MIDWLIRVDPVFEEPLQTLLIRLKGVLSKPPSGR